MQRSKFEQLKQFAAMLGWRSLREFRHIIKEDAPGISAGTLIRWYESGSIDHMFLQINELPPYQAAVYAMRYRLCTGWHAFKLYPGARMQAKEAARLEEWLHRKWFTTIERRREFRRRHPECCNYTWRKIAECGTPIPKGQRTSGGTQ
jgi:hypothetical protein